MKHSKLFVAGVAVLALGGCYTMPADSDGQQGTREYTGSSAEPGATGNGASGNFSKNESSGNTGGTEYSSSSASTGMTKDAGATESTDAGTGAR
jgi:hypothetical protein